MCIPVMLPWGCGTSFVLWTHLQQQQAQSFPLLHFFFVTAAVPFAPSEEGWGCKSDFLVCCLPSQGSSVRRAGPRAAPGHWWLMNALLHIDGSPLAVQPQILLIMLGVDKVRRSPRAGIYQPSPEKCNFSWAAHFPMAPAPPSPHKAPSAAIYCWAPAATARPCHCEDKLNWAFPYCVGLKHVFLCLLR